MTTRPLLPKRRASASPGWRSSLSPEERKRTAIFGNDYGEAGAIDFYGPGLGLPGAIGGHLTYWLWGPRNSHSSSAGTQGVDVPGDLAAAETMELIPRVAAGVIRIPARMHSRVK